MNRPENTEPRIQGDGNVVGDESTSQVIKAFRSVVKNVVQVAGDLVVRVPSWGLIAAAALIAAGIILAVAIPSIPVLRELLPTPMAFAPASADQSLIIVADFDDRSGSKYRGMDPAQYIYEQLVAQVQADGLDVRIERLREVVDDNTARPTGEAYNATLVLWGWYDALSITPRIEFIRTLVEYHPAGGWMHLSLADPEKVEFSIITDLPSQAAYLTLFALGMDEYVKEDHDQALEYMNSALAAIPKDTKVSTNPSDVYFYRGNIYLFNADYKAALADYTHALNLKPQYAIAYNNRGIVHKAIGEYESALADFTLALGLDSELDEAYNNRGTTYCDMGKYESALVDFTRALEIDPEDAEVYYNRGSAYKSMSKYELALADYARAVELNPNYTDAYYNRGNLYLALGQYDLARADYTRVLDLDSEAVDACYNRGIAYLAMGEYKAALGDFTRTLELNPKVAEAYNNRGNVYLAMGDYKSALADYTCALEINPEFADARFNRGVVYEGLGQVEKAIADFERFLELSTDPELRAQAEQYLRELRGE